MYRNRVVPVVLLDGDRVVKTLKFSSGKYIGDPVNVCKIFSDKEVDELCLIDIKATLDKREPSYELIHEIASECFMPLTYGGGIDSFDVAKRIFDLGVEKVSINTAIDRHPELIREVASVYGAQSVSVMINIKRGFLGSYKSFNYQTGAKQAIEDALGKIDFEYCGELSFNMVDRDGAMSGIDLEFIDRYMRPIKIQTLYMGGVASISDIQASLLAGADAVGVGAFFSFHGPHKAVLISYLTEDQKQRLGEGFSR